MRRRQGLVLLVAVLIALTLSVIGTLLLTGHSGGGPTPGRVPLPRGFGESSSPTPPSVPPSPLPSTLPAGAELPRGIAAQVLQYRSDYGPRQLQLEITNAGHSDIVVTAATFRSPFFTRPVTWNRFPANVLAGGAVDLPVVLPPPSCDGQVATSAGARPRITIAYESEGKRGSATLVPTEPFGSLETVHDDDCAKQAFERIAAITPATKLRLTTAADGRLTAVLDLAITPDPGASGTAVLRDIRSTILLDIVPQTALPLSFVPGSAPATLSLAITPTRCDEHVIAEDKVGTILPVAVDVGPYANQLFSIVSSDDLKLQLYAYVAKACGW
jgi:hypothetical protein